jgi:glycosyltransferase involved in cell wall biosynthesis
MATSISDGKDETITVLVPDIHDLQTGGNVYNRRMVAGMRPEASVRVVAWTPDESDPLDLPASGVVVVDSLLAQHPDALRTVQVRHPAATFVLLVHYLHCVDPHTGDPSIAAHERKTLRAIDGALTTSRFTRRALMEEGVPADRVQVVRPGLGERYRGGRPARLERGAPRMLTVANLLPTKGLRPFVDVLRDLRDLPWTWTLVGDASLDPEYAEQVSRRLRAAGLTGRVTWTGAIPPETLRTWYDRADLFVLPSRFETCSLSTREAMARGLPVVGYRVGGLPENFGDTAAGHLAPSSNAVALRAALRSLLTDPMARAQRGFAAWQRSRAFPTWAEAADQFREGLATLHTRASEGV